MNADADDDWQSQSKLSATGVDRKTFTDVHKKHFCYGHSVQFFNSDDFFTQSLSMFVVTAIDNDEGAVVIATAPHLEMLRKRVGEYCATLKRPRDPETIFGQQVMLFDAHTTLRSLMTDGGQGKISAELFARAIQPVVLQLKEKFSVLRLYGEMVSILFQDGEFDKLVDLETVWGDFLRDHPFCTLLCGYNVDDFASVRHDHDFQRVCELHRSVISSEQFLSLENEENMKLVAHLMHKTACLQTELAERASLERKLIKYQEELEKAKNDAVPYLL